RGPGRRPPGPRAGSGPADLGGVPGRPARLVKREQIEPASSSAIQGGEIFDIVISVGVVARPTTTSAQPSTSARGYLDGWIRTAMTTRRASLLNSTALAWAAKWQECASLNDSGVDLTGEADIGLACQQQFAGQEAGHMSRSHPWERTDALWERVQPLIGPD